MMADSSLTLAKVAYRHGRFADALRLAQATTVQSKKESDERDCLVCECLQFKGELEKASALAEVAVGKPATAEYAARYWQVIGRVRITQVRREEAAEALRKGIRAASRSADAAILASLQQVWLTAASETLGPGLGSAVREAYQAAVRSADGTAIAGFHVRLARIEGERGAFGQSLHHLSLAKSLLERYPHTSLAALYHVNHACVLAMTGAFHAARKSGEVAAGLAQQAGHLQLVMAAAATVSYSALSSGDLSIAESWARKAWSAAQTLGIVEVGLLDNFATLALIQGDLKAAASHLQQARSFFRSRDPKWARPNEILTLFTELEIHKRTGDRDQFQNVLDLIRVTGQPLNDQHSPLLANLAEAEALFDDRCYPAAEQKTAECLGRALTHPVYLAQLSRMMARSLWVRGHKNSARRMLLRSFSCALLRGNPLALTDVLRELESSESQDPLDAAHSLEEQSKRAGSKFIALMADERPTWYEQAPVVSEAGRDPLDGFDDAVGILVTRADPELRGREALAACIALDISVSADLISRGDSGTRVIASSLSKPLTETLLKDSPLERIDIGKVEHRNIELILRPKQDLRSLFAVAGIRRLLEAAKALEAHQKDQQRIGSLWQPEIIVEEPDAVFTSPQMIELMQTARKVAVTTLPVLLMGATGTGKEVVARAIHRASPRANQVFLPFNCSAVPRDMVESQLFGYRRGSFTGAHVDFPGIIRSAEGGTIFLDEIGELSMDLQPKLLRFLETNEVHPLGEGRPIKVDVRIIAATNADLEDLIQLKEFREDLYYRLNIVRFQMPQLSERREEIPPLVMHLLRRFEMDEKKHGIKLSDEMMEYLLLYKWPGNVRQLSNELRRMVAMVGSNETLTPDHLSPAIRATRRTIEVDPDAAPPPEPEAETETPATADLTLKLDQPLPEAVAVLERAMIEHAMARADGKIEEAARLLGISRKGLFLKRRRWTSDGEPPSKPV
ncbi:MAG: sigma-54 dependent transcriptional regulator [Vicinamibacterales bacterium]